MSQLLLGFQEYKDQIPEFIIKLYHILQKKQYDDFLCWNGNDQILIKSGKKLQDKVLPHFFRHKHLSSFIRQLNMYKFSKVTKLTKQKKYMYFKNQFFQKGHIKQLMRIKRNNKKNRQSPENSTTLKSFNDQDVSFMNQASQENSLLINYKNQVKKSLLSINEILSRVMEKFPQTVLDLSIAKNICNAIMQGQECEDKQCPQKQQFSLNISSQQFEKGNNKNMLTTQKNIPKLQSPIFVSQISFNSFM